MRMELPDESINNLQRMSLSTLKDTLKWAKSADIIVRKDGQDYHFEADWLKHLKIEKETA